MGGVVLLQRGNTPNNWSSTSDPTNAFDAGDGVRVGDHWYNTASGNTFYCVSNTVGAAVWRHIPRVLGMNGATGQTHTGNTSETAIASVTVPAGAMGASGLIRVRYQGAMTNNANLKTLRVRFSSISGTIFESAALTSVLGMWREVVIANRTTGTQIGRNESNATGGWASYTTSVTSSVDTTAATSVVLSVQLANSADTAGVDFYSVELLRPDIT